jgi:hypothetical protein
MAGRQPPRGAGVFLVTTPPVAFLRLEDVARCSHKGRGLLECTCRFKPAGVFRVTTPSGLSAIFPIWGAEASRGGAFMRNSKSRCYRARGGRRDGDDNVAEPVIGESDDHAFSADVVTGAPDRPADGQRRP